VKAAIAISVSAIVIAAACRPPAFLVGGRRLSGTCEGACDHYFECRGGAQTPNATQKCVDDCHDVFSDDESLRAYESLDCQDAIEYVDGTRSQARR
jgi:hypothetical protein